jgi:hypothetical protein
MEVKKKTTGERKEKEREGEGKERKEGERGFNTLIEDRTKFRSVFIYNKKS